MTTVDATVMPLLDGKAYNHLAAYVTTTPVMFLRKTIDAETVRVEKHSVVCKQRHLHL